MFCFGWFVLVGWLVGLFCLFVCVFVCLSVSFVSSHVLFGSSLLTSHPISMCLWDPVGTCRPLRSTVTITMIGTLRRSAARSTHVAPKGHDDVRLIVSGGTVGSPDRHTLRLVPSELIVDLVKDLLMGMFSWMDVHASTPDYANWTHG